MESRSTVLILAAISLAQVAATAAEPWYAIVEAESMKINSGWQVVKGREGYCAAYPNFWSGNRLRGNSGETPAEAVKEITVPAAGRYAVWARYESPYGFDVLFTVELRQNGKTVLSAPFGDRADRKCFNGQWRVQGPWAYHNTDYVYQRAEAELAAGPTVVALCKGVNGKYGAARVVDLICLTDDLAMEPGREYIPYAPAPIQTRCVRPVYFRLSIARNAPAPGRARMRFGSWEAPGNRAPAPERDFLFTTNGLRQLQRGEKPSTTNVEEALPPGSDSGWQRVDLNTWCPARLSITASVPATLSVSHHADGNSAEVFELTGPSRDIFVATGNSRLEDDVVQGKPAVFFADFLQRYVKKLDAYKPPGKRAFKFAISAIGGGMDGFDGRELTRAFGSSAVYFRCQPEYYLPENAQRWGINRGMGYMMMQNSPLRREFFEGAYHYNARSPDPVGAPTILVIPSEARNLAG